MALPGARHPGRAVVVLDSCFPYSVHAVVQPERGGCQGLLYVTWRTVKKIAKGLP